MFHKKVKDIGINWKEEKKVSVISSAVETQF